MWKVCVTDKYCQYKSDMGYCGYTGTECVKETRMKLINLYDGRHCYVGNDGEYERWNIDTEAPTIDAVEVVRCKDCRKNPKIAWFECPMAGKSLVFDNGFCHMGERREG